MEKSFVYFDTILSKLAQSYPRGCAFEELTALVIPAYNILRTFTENIAAQRKNHAKLLDALMALDDMGVHCSEPGYRSKPYNHKGPDQNK